MGSATAEKRIETEAARIGFIKVRGMNGDQHKCAWKITCAECKKEFSAYWPVSIPPQQMVKNMRIRHWDVGLGERPFCPNCAHPDRSKKPPPRPEYQSFERFISPEPNTTMFKAFKNMLVNGGMKPKDVQESPEAMAALRDAVIATPLPGGLPTRAEDSNLPPSQQAMLMSERKIFHSNAVSTLVDATEQLVTTQIELAHTQAELLAARQQRMANARAERLKRLTKRREERDALAAQIAAERAARLRQQEVLWKQPPAAAPAPPAGSAWINNRTTLVTVEKPEMTAIAANRPTPAPKLVRAIYQMFDSVFDEDKKRYKMSYSDQRVASECGTTEEIVKWLREENFGKLSEDPRLQNISDDLELLRMELVEFVKGFNVRFNELKSRLDQARGEK